MTTSHEEFENFQQIWNQAQAEFSKEVRKPRPSTDFFGFSSKLEGEVDPKDAEEWWRVSNLDTDDSEEEMIVETNESKDSYKELIDAIARAQNSVPVSTIGKDQDYKPILADETQLEQLHDMKMSLYDLECKLNTKDAFGKTNEGKKIQGQIDALREKIDDLSNAITPDFLKTYLS